MITSTVGKIFLEAYNEKYGTNYDAQSFFIERFGPLFFNSDKKMMKAGNTALGNPAYNRKSYDERFSILLDKIDCNQLDSSVCIDFPSFDASNRSSGQITGFKSPLTREDVFYSWIGNGLKVGVKSELTGKEEISILFFDRKTLLDIYEGWIHYRKTLDNTQKLQEKQVHVWNAHWIYQIYSSSHFDKNNPPKDICKYIPKKESLSIEALDWIKIVVSIAKSRDMNSILSYISGMDKNNNFITIGFRTFCLNQIRYPIDLYEKYFGLDNGLIADSLWKTEYGLKTCCKFGAIGIKAMEPEGLRDYIFNGRSPKFTKKQIIKKNIYQIWILAMLNNDELWDKSQELAEFLSNAAKDEKDSTRKKQENLVNKVVAAVNKKQFVTAVDELIPYVTDKGKFKEYVRMVHCMPSDNVPYFLVLLRFQFHSL